MSTVPEAQQTAIAIGQTVISPQPNQIAFALTKDKFDLLQHGIVPEEKQSMDFCLGVALGSLIGLISLAATLDWHKISAYIWAFPVAVIFLCTLICFFFFRHKVKSSKSAPGCVRVKAEIESHFS